MKHKQSSDFHKKKNQKRMHQPGIEPGSVPWQGTILPLDHWCLMLKEIKQNIYNPKRSFNPIFVNG